MEIDHREFDRGVADAIGHLKAAPIPSKFLQLVMAKDLAGWKKLVEKSDLCSEGERPCAHNAPNMDAI